jgi:signal transduction histidine kinase/ligand-binding sensor domain-containing protein/AraC-like DNA-binding protein
MPIGFSQQINLTHINTKQGLPGSNVRKLHQDPFGYIWFGIEAVGLCKYDGVEFQMFIHNPHDKNSISNNFIWDIKSDKKNLWIATESGLNLYLRNKNKFFNFQTHNSNITDNWTASLYLDSYNNLWIGTNDGLNKLSESDLQNIYSSINTKENVIQHIKFHHYLYNDSITNKLGKIKINQIREDLEHNLWICTNIGVFIFDSLSNLKEHLYKKADQKTGLINNKVYFVSQYSDSTMLLGTDRGLCLYEPLTNKYYYNVFPQLRELNLEYKGYYCFIKDSGGTMWIGMSEGLVIINKKLPLEEGFQFISKDKAGLTSKIIRDILEDNSNQVWISTKFGGLHLFKKHRDLFHTFNIKNIVNKTNSNNDNFIISLFADSKDNIWLGTKHGGLFKNNLKTDSYESYWIDVNLTNPLNSNRIENINEDSYGNIWTGTPKGLNMLNTDNGKTIHYPFHQISSLFDDYEGNFWIGSFCGLYLFDRKKQSFESFTQSKHSHFFSNNSLIINTIIKDKKSNLWFGTYQNGLYWYNAKTDSLRHFARNQEENYQISGDMIRAIYEDDEGNIWIGTKHNGLNCFSYKSNKIKNFNVTDGLPSNTIYSILSDSMDDLWIGTHNGLSVYHKKSGKFQNFDESHGLQSNIFENDANAKTKNGLLLFGGCNGFNMFQPEDIKIEPIDGQLVIKSVKINNKDYLIDIEKDTTIRLKHFQNYIELKFALLSFINPSKTNYRYKMKGVDKDWIDAGTRNFVSYSNLKDGEYTFFLEANDSDNSSISNPIRMNISIIPPYWKTKMAIIIYILFLIFLLYQIHRIVNIRTNYINRLNETRKTIQHTIEMNEAKLRFFTNVSHEIKTPLSLISAPVEKLSNSSNISEVDKKHILLIQKNTKRLLRLIEELLYFRKAQDEVIQLKAMKGDIVNFIEEITQPYAAFAEQNNIRFKLYSHEPSIELWFDPDKIEKIISNLLMNAFKFTQHHGSVEVTIENETINPKNRNIYTKNNVEPKMVKINVKDTGMGIAKDELKYIFQHYYTSNHTHNYNGTGLGLELTKTLVELHGGTITVESTEGKGSIFSFSLYKGNKHLKRNQKSESKIIAEKYINEVDFSELLFESYNSPEISEHDSTSANKPLVLVVEDDNDLREFMRENLSAKYNVLLAKDGKEGLSLALQNIPDMVISDVMMPNMDGIQLCKRLKSEQITCHIPIILLTRKNDIEDQIAGLKTGADDYLSKPFNMQFLILRIHNIFNTIKMFKTQILKELGEGRIESEAISSYDKSLLNKCLNAVSDNISDAEFSVSELCKIVGMSRSQLYRKISALTGQSPAEFIYSNRLIKAKKLLLNKEYTIMEVAHLTGFKSSNSFSTVFKKNFGISPKDYTEKSILKCS